MRIDAGMIPSQEFQPEAAYAAADPGALSPALRRVGLILRRRWLLFSGLWLLVSLSALALSMTFDPVYRPQSTLEVRPEMSLVPTEQSETSYIASLQMWANFYRTQ